LVILVIAALVGARVLQVFGVSLDAFSVAGGGVLAWIWFTMLRGDSAPVPATKNQKRSLTPVILFAASPGTITGVITIAVVHTRLALPVTALVAVAVATVVMWIMMVLVGREGTQPGNGFLRDTATRFMGLIVIAIGTQFALTGLRDFFIKRPY
jgi:multiple antibiotic resistance protein